MAIEDHHLRVMSYCYTTHTSDMDAMFDNIVQYSERKKYYNFR